MWHCRSLLAYWVWRLGWRLSRAATDDADNIHVNNRKLMKDRMNDPRSLKDGDVGTIIPQMTEQGDNLLFLFFTVCWRRLHWETSSGDE